MSDYINNTSSIQYDRKGRPYTLRPGCALKVYLDNPLQQRTGLQQKKPLARGGPIGKKVGKKRCDSGGKVYNPDTYEKEQKHLAMLRDGRKCQCPDCGGAKEPADQVHHIIALGSGGRGDTHEAINCQHLLTAINGAKCHTLPDHDYDVWPYYQQAWLTDYHERVVLMEMFIEEWAGDIPPGFAGTLNEIRKRSRRRWETILGYVTPKATSAMIRDRWHEYLELGLSEELPETAEDMTMVEDVFYEEFDY